MHSNKTLNVDVGDKKKRNESEDSNKKLIDKKIETKIEMATEEQIKCERDEKEEAVDQAISKNDTSVSIQPEAIVAEQSLTKTDADENVNIEEKQKEDFLTLKEPEAEIKHIESTLSQFTNNSCLKADETIDSLKATSSLTTAHEESSVVSPLLQELTDPSIEDKNLLSANEQPLALNTDNYSDENLTKINCQVSVEAVSSSENNQQESKELENEQKNDIEPELISSTQSITTLGDREEGTSEQSLSPLEDKSADLMQQQKSQNQDYVDHTNKSLKVEESQTVEKTQEYQKSPVNPSPDHESDCNSIGSIKIEAITATNAYASQISDASSEKLNEDLTKAICETARLTLDVLSKEACDSVSSSITMPSVSTLSNLKSERSEPTQPLNSTTSSVKLKPKVKSKQSNSKSQSQSRTIKNILKAQYGSLDDSPPPPVSVSPANVNNQLPNSPSQPVTTISEVAVIAPSSIDSIIDLVIDYFHY
jgi:hypothetical protein